MGSRTRSALIDRIEVILEDTGNSIFPAASISSELDTSLVEGSRYYPRIVRESRLLAEADKTVDLSGIVNLLDFSRDGIEDVEHPVDEYPRNYRNFDITGETLEILMSTEPAADDEVVLVCRKVHTLVDPPSSLAGAVNLLAGYSAGDTSIALDGLGTGTIKAGTLVTFTGIIGEYRVTADVSIVANAGTIVITPALLEDMDDNTVVAFKCNTLPTVLEEIMAEYVAGKMALNWVGSGRSQIALAVSALADCNTKLDTVDARISAAIADISSGRGLVSDGLSQAETALDAVAALVTGALSSLTSGASFINALPTYADPAGAHAQQASLKLSGANAKLSEAQGYIAKANQSGNYSSVGARELQTVSAIIGQASGFLREASSRMNIPSIQRNMNIWGQAKLNYALNELRKAPSRQVFYRE